MSGQRKVTIREVAEAAGVSPATVSLVYNDKGEIAASTRERVLDVGGRLGYRPGWISKAFRTGRTRVIGVVVGHSTTQIWELTYLPYYRGIIAGAAMEALEHGYSITAVPVGGSSKGLDGPTMPDGVIVVDPGPDDPLVESALDSGMAVVSAGGYSGSSESSRLRSVQIETHRGVPAALDALVASGASWPAFFRGSVDDEYTSSSQAAYEAWCKARNSAPLVYILPPGQAPIDGARALISGEFGACDAVYCINETYGGAVTIAAAEAQVSIPESFAVSVVTETNVAPLDSRLVYLNLDSIALGAQCARILIDILEGKSPEDGWLPIPIEGQP